MLLVSSGAVYGRQPPGLIALSESHTGAPDPLKPELFAEAGRLIRRHKDNYWIVGMTVCTIFEVAISAPCSPCRNCEICDACR